MAECICLLLMTWTVGELADTAAGARLQQTFQGRWDLVAVTIAGCRNEVKNDRGFHFVVEKDTLDGDGVIIASGEYRLLFQNGQAALIFRSHFGKRLVLQWYQCEFVDDTLYLAGPYLQPVTLGTPRTITG